VNLKILLPYRVFIQKNDVSRIIAETGDGSTALLPHRLDCVAALLPGILVYSTPVDGTVYLAVDEGVLVKSGAEVLVSVRHAIGGADLRALQTCVRREFLVIDAQGQEVRAAVAKMEGAFAGLFAEFQHGR
jgi:F-type H+-transporting ATPase subunit epsilon